MPKYNYRCNSCDYRFEVEQRMNDEALVQCPECEQDSLQKVIGLNVGIAFKGSGFYTNTGSEVKTNTPATCDNKQKGACCC